ASCSAYWPSVATALNVILPPPQNPKPELTGDLRHVTIIARNAGYSETAIRLVEPGFSSALPARRSVRSSIHAVLDRAVQRPPAARNLSAGTALARTRNDFRLCLCRHHRISFHRGAQLDKRADTCRQHPRL